jgi:hypothetical protein
MTSVCGPYNLAGSATPARSRAMRTQCCEAKEVVRAGQGRAGRSGDAASPPREAREATADAVGRRRTARWIGAVRDDKYQWRAGCWRQGYFGHFPSLSLHESEKWIKYWLWCVTAKKPQIYNGTGQILLVAVSISLLRILTVLQQNFPNYQGWWK